MRHADARNPDAWIELSEELSLERVFPSEFRRLAGYFAGRIDPQLKNEAIIYARILCPVRCHVLLTCLALHDEVTRDWLTPVLRSLRLAARVRAELLLNQARNRNRISGIPHRAC